jgi:hypothetical protein
VIEPGAKQVAANAASGSSLTEREAILGARRIVSRDPRASASAAAKHYLKTLEASICSTSRLQGTFEMLGVAA